MIVLWIVLSFVALVLGIGIGYFLSLQILKSKSKNSELAAKQMLKKAESRSSQILHDAKRNANKIGFNANRFKDNQDKLNNSRRNLQKTEHSLRNREVKVNRAEQIVKTKEERLNAREANFESDLSRRKTKFEQDLKDVREEVFKLRDKYVSQLSSIAGITEKEAQNKVFSEAKEAMSSEISMHYRKTDKELRTKAEDKARYILAHSIQRMASEVVTNITTTSIKLGNKDLKGRLIGREGRNVKALEAATGVNLIINSEDQSEEEIVLSSFDPLRRAIAKMSIEELINDGRIQPERIERTVKKVEEQISKEVVKIGEQAVYDVGLKTLPKELVKIMGKLNYRTSYGSNVLQHSIEVGLLAGSIAAEIGADVETCRTAGFLHDIGKAFTPESNKPHAEIGADLVKSHGLSEDIELAIREHHNPEMTTTESFIVAAADAVSAARPGVRNDGAAKFNERMSDLEKLILEFKGVNKCFAMQSGHEVRVLVNPEVVNDVRAPILAQEIATKIRAQSNIPGEVRVQVIREIRAEAVTS